MHSPILGAHIYKQVTAELEQCWLDAFSDAHTINNTTCAYMPM